MDKPKGGLGLLIGLGKPKGDEGDEEADESLNAAKALIDAVKSGDAAGVRDALRLCNEEYKSDSMEG